MARPFAVPYDVLSAVLVLLLAPGIPRQEGIDNHVPAESIKKLSRLPEFVRAYEPDGMHPEDFLSFGLVQRTLSQFMTGGWDHIADFKPA